jgi:UPF0755 protein
VAAGLGLCALGAGIGWYKSAAGGGRPGPAVVVSVRPGASFAAVAGLLARQQVVGSALAFRLYAFFHGTPTVEAGDYQLPRHDSFAAAAAVLGAPPNVIPLVVQPGITMSELAAKAATIPGHSRGSFLQAAAAVAPNSPFAPAGETSLEGLLGLGRYLVRPGETDRQVLTAMERRFTAEAQNLDLTGAAAALGITPYQAIIVASIVQKEAFTSGASSAVGMANAPKVARVIYNRLAAGMALQMDSTVLYAENRDGGPVSRQDLSLASPYNTYRTPGLTPTPICFPSTQALQAALHPAAGPWLYFVLTSADGAETFSSTLAQQLQAEAVARRRGLP